MHPRGVFRLDLPRYLSALPLFHASEADELDRLAGGSTLRGYERGEALFHAEERCEGLHLAVTGHVKLFVLSALGQEKVIEIAGPGQSFAESLMFTGAPYNLNAQALTDAMVLTVRKETVLAEIERGPRFSLRMLGLVSRRVHGLERDVQDYTLRNAAQRVAAYLLRELPDTAGCHRGVTVSLPVSKATVASRLSLTHEHFSRVLHEMEARGLIEIRGREIRIPDASLLVA